MQKNNNNNKEKRKRRTDMSGSGTITILHIKRQNSFRLLASYYSEQ